LEKRKGSDLSKHKKPKNWIEQSENSLLEQKKQTHIKKNERQKEPRKETKETKRGGGKERWVRLEGEGGGSVGLFLLDAETWKKEASIWGLQIKMGLKEFQGGEGNSDGIWRRKKNICKSWVLQKKLTKGSHTTGYRIE